MAKGKKLTTILFDLDGTLRDSRDAIHPAIIMALKTYGVDTNADGIIDTVHNLREVYAAFTPDVQYETFRDTYEANMKSLMHTVVLYEHVREVLDELKGRGYKIGLVSSSRLANEGVEQENLSHFFDVIVAGRDTENHKPHPEPIYAALEKLKTPPNQSVMVGDLAVDILAGKAADVAATIGITHGFGTRKVLQDAGADYIIDSLKALPETLDAIE